MKVQIELDSMNFYAFHGVAPQERTVGNTFIVDLLLTADVEAATVSDNLDDTINYAEVYAVVKQEMDRPSLLLEAVAGRIVAALHKEFSRIMKVRVKVAKLNPPFGGDVRSAAVTLEE